VKLLAVHQGGGVGGAPVSLLKLLSRLDVEARAIFTERGPILDYAAELGVPAQVIPTGGAFYFSAHARLEPRGVLRFIRTFPRAVQQARVVLRRAKPDVVHLNTSVLLAWAAAARRERLPVVWVVREVLGAPPLRYWQASFIQRHATRLVVISDAVRACFPGADARLVYNAVDLREFAPAGPSADTRTVALVGSVQRAKGHWLALDAIELVPEATLMLVTGGADASYASSARGRVKRLLGMPLDNLEALMREARKKDIDKRVVVSGWRRDIPAVLAAADVVVFPSLAAEGFGRPIIEAMAMARPVVATDVGPSRELLGDAAGRLVPADPLELADAIRELLGDPALRARMGQAGRARAEACFGLERQLAAMRAIYREAGGVA
jgi:glycosyltransferase involved in cell wall biosynthesis